MTTQLIPVNEVQTIDTTPRAARKRNVFFIATKKKTVARQVKTIVKERYPAGLVSLIAQSRAIAFGAAKYAPADVIRRNPSPPAAIARSAAQIGIEAMLANHVRYATRDAQMMPESPIIAKIGVTAST